MVAALALVAAALVVMPLFAGHTRPTGDKLYLIPLLSDPLAYFLRIASRFSSFLRTKVCT